MHIFLLDADLQHWSYNFENKGINIILVKLKCLQEDTEWNVTIFVTYLFFQEEGTVDFAKLMMGKISGTVNSRSDGETKVTVALETLYVLNIKPDSRHIVKK